MNTPASFPSPETLLAHRVSYGETDTMGLLYYGEYLHLFERSRSQYIRERGMSYADVEKKGLFLPVREASCRYKIPSRYDDLIWVRTGICEWGKASMKFTYEILDEEQSKVRASGMTEHACVNGGGRPVRVPEWLRELFS